MKKLRGKKMNNKKMDMQKGQDAMGLPNSKAPQPTKFGGETKGKCGGHESGWF